MTAAIFGLIGVVVGAAVNGVVSYLLASRHEKADAKAAARLVHSELRAHLHVLDSVLKAGTFGEIPPDPPTVDEWAAHRSILARTLSNDAWANIAWSYNDMAVLASAYKSGAERCGVNPETRAVLIEMRSGLAQALAAAQAVARGQKVDREAVNTYLENDPGPPPAPE